MKPVRRLSSKPFDVDELRIVIDRVLNSSELEREVKQLRASSGPALCLS